MKLGLRGKLIVVSVALMLVAGGAAGAYLESTLRERLELRIEAELASYARTVKEAVEASGSWGSVAEVDPLADRLGAATGTRVTVIAADGRLLGDSRLTPDEVIAAERHEGRPEVIAARSGGPGTSRRFSTTVGRELLYVAVPFDRSDGAGVVRVARPLQEVDEAVGQLRLILGLAGLVGLAIAFLMVALASHFMTRTIRALVARARSVARGEKRHVPVASGDELGTLAGSINRLAEELDRTVQELASERDRIGAVLGGMHEAVLAVDERLEVRLVNRAARELLKLDVEPEGRPLLAVIRAPALQPLLEEERGDGPTSVEFDLPGPPRRRILGAVADLAAGGRVIVMHDVTEIRRLETVRSDFVANVSHELRTPVSVVQANAETLLDGALDYPARSRQFVRAVLRNARRMGAIIDDLLSLARLEAGRHPLELGPVSVAKAVQAAVDTLDAPSAVAGRARELDLRIDVPADLFCVADRLALDHALVNLLENAAKYAHESGPIQVRASTDGDSLILEVHDEGPGIAEHHRDRIFERFYRVDPGRSRETGGTGLGLAIVKHLVEAMGGTVGFRPGTPKGSVFWVRLRAAPSEMSSVTESSRSRR